ncbi:MAG TPA: carbamoyltransferase HypF [Acidothermaceae bacterium]
MKDDGRSAGVLAVERSRVEKTAWRLDVRGTVQGVGFRPFVYRLATELGLTGSVRNAGGHVLIEAAGDRVALAELARRLPQEAPPLARVREVGIADLLTAPTGTGFRIEQSEQVVARSNEVPPDIATCDDCLAELSDPTDRRYRYPFVNCTNCGPRATIIDELPYDRSRTAMRVFPLCPDCRREYEDPGNRRFHAEPVACPVCGPALSWLGARLGGDAHGEAALMVAEAALRHGAIVALKGLGGYQLVCDATRPDVVRRLRALKQRPAKPLAVMVADLQAAAEVAELTESERLLLRSPQRPIVLATARHDSPVTAVVSNGGGRIGLFLPNTPLHHLLMGDLRRPMVVTSGNLADEPMAIDDDDARAALTDLVDGFLSHDRPIRSRYDDSVVHVVDGLPRTIRRARGYAPEPRSLPVPAAAPLLAVGAELKHTFTLAAEGRAVVSPHIGDLENASAYEAFTNSVERLSAMVGITPEFVVHDYHPSYLSTHYAREWRPGKRMEVQHHHAHVAACAAEFGLDRPFIGVAYDGLGMGDDGTLWGGEIFIADLRRYRRFGRFSLAPLPGGALAVKRPIRMALGYLLAAEDFAEPVRTGNRDAARLREIARQLLPRMDEQEFDVVEKLIAAKLNCPKASSAGRLFDAVASLLGLRDEASFEGEAAIALEEAASSGEPGELPWALRKSGDLWVYDVRPTLLGVADAVRGDVPAGVVAARFQATIVAVTAALCDAARAATGISDVCLGGGVFQNRAVAGGVVSTLRAEGHDVYLGEHIPVNDGGISYGQAAVAAARMARR